MTFERATASTPDLVAFVIDAQLRMASHRGGPELLATIVGESSIDDLLIQLVEGGHLWILDVEGLVQGFAIVRNHVVEAMFVTPGRRRRGEARSMISALLELEDPPRDAYALPGDRAMKSLYESIGWKARLLTMRGG